MRFLLPPVARVSVALLAASLLAAPLPAATRTWTGGAIANDKWSDNDNWSGGVSPGDGDTLVFPNGIQATDLSMNNDIGGEVFQQLRFDGPGYSVSGDIVRLSAGGLLSTTSGLAVEFLAGLRLTADQTFQIAPGLGVAVRAPGVLDVGGHALTLSGGALALWANLAGSGSVFLNSGAVLVLSGPSTFTGPITSNAGSSVNLILPAALGTTAAPTFIRDGGRLAVLGAASATIPEEIRLDGGGEILVTVGPQSTPPGLTVTFSGPLILGGAGAHSIFNSSAGQSHWSGRISGTGSFDKTGPNPLILTGGQANTYTGFVNVRDGVLALAKPPGFAALTGLVTVFGPNARLRLDANEQIDDGVNVQIQGGGTLDLGAQAETIAGLFLSGGSVTGTVDALLSLSRILYISGEGPSQVDATVRLLATPTELTVNGSAPSDLTFTRPILGVGGAGLLKLGTGSVRIAQFSGGGLIDLAGGSMVLGPTDPSPVTISYGATLAGTGPVGAITAGAGGGRIDPGDGLGALVSGTVTLNAQSVFAPGIRSAAASGHDVLRVTGTVTLNGATLAPVLAPPLSLALGESVVILENDGTDPIVGTFAGLAQGAEVAVGRVSFRISYFGGTGNDVTLTVSDLPVSGVVRTWTGLGAGTGTDLALNWNPASAPNPGDQLVFPGSVPANKRTVTDTIPGFDFYDRLEFGGGGWNFGNGAISLKNGIRSTLTSGSDAVQLGLFLILTAPQTFDNAGAGTLSLNFPTGSVVNLNGQTLTCQTGQATSRIVIGEDPGGLQPADAIFGSGGATGTLLKTGPGTLTLKSFSSYTGLTTISAGTLEALDNDALGASGPGNGTIVAQGATLLLGRSSGFLQFFAEELTLDGTLISRSNGPGFGANRITSTVQLALPDRSVVVETGELQLDGTVQGAGGLHKSGPGILLIGSPIFGLNSNTFAGRLLVSEGTVVLQKSPGTNAVSAEVVLQGTVPRLELRASEQLTARLTLSNGVFDLGAFNETLPQLFLGGASVLGSGTLSVETDIVVDSPIGSAVISAPLRAANATLNLKVLGASDLNVNGSISSAATGATLVRLGAGRAFFFGASTIANFDLRSGLTSVAGDCAPTAIQLNAGTLLGTGTVGPITSGLTGGAVAPGDLTGLGTLNSGAVSWNASTHFSVGLRTPTEFGQLNVTGTVNLNGAQLDVSLASTFAATAADTFIILQNDGVDPIVGTFAGLPENATFSVGGRTFRISYVGGSGNDVTVRLFQLGTGIARQWTGNSDVNWTTPGNWIGGVAPSAGDDLIFPLLGSVRRVNVNTFPANTTFNSIQLQGSGYSLSGASVVLNDGFKFDFSVGASSVLLPIVCAQAQTFSAAGGAQATIDPSTTLNNGGFPLTLEVSSATARLTVRDVSGGGALRKTGPGPVTLTANTHTGPNEFLAGEVLLDGTVTGLGAGAGSTIVGGPATLRLNAVPAVTITTPLTLGGLLACVNSPVTFSGAVNLSGSDVAVVDVSGAGIPTLSGLISGLGGLRKAGAGDLILSGVNPNTFTGGLFVAAGVLRAQKSAGSGLTPGPLTIGDGTATVAELRLINANQIPSIAVTLNGAGAHLNCNGLSETIGSLALTGGTVSAGNTPATALILSTGGVTTFAAATPAIIHGNLTASFSGVKFWTIEDGAAADDLILDGTVASSAGFVLVKQGEGRIVFAGNATFPKLRLEYGTAAFTGNGAAVAVELGSFGGNQSTLTGSGITGAVTTPTVIGGKLAPSGILTTSGNATLNAETRVQIRLLNPTPGSGHDQLAVLGTPTLGDAALELTSQPGFAPVFGQVFRILDNNGSADPVVGTFAGLPEGALLDLGGLAMLRISYVGGDGNDVTLTVTRAAGTGVTRVWDGGSGTDSNWTTAANWVGDVAPSPGDALEFPVGAARTSNTNDFPALTTFDSIRFSGSGYAIGGTNSIVLNGGMRAEASIGAISFSSPVVLSSPQTFAAEAGAALTLLPGATVNTNGQLLTLQDAVAVGLSAIDLQGVISGPGGLAKTGSGTLFIRGNNTFSGPVDVQEGGVQIFHVNALGTTDVGTTIRAGAFLQFNSASLTVAEPISLLGTVFSTTGTNLLTGPLTLPGPTAGTLSCGSALTVSGVISGPGALVKTGLADLALAGPTPNTFTGGFVLQEMNAFLQKTAGIVALPGPVTVGNGFPPNELRLLNANQIGDTGVVALAKGTLNLNSLAETIGGLILTEGTLNTGSATLILDGDLESFPAANPSILNGQVQVKGPNGGTRLWKVEDGAAVEDLQVSAVVSATTGTTLEKTGTGRARFNAANTFLLFTARSGTTIIAGNSGLASVRLEGGALGGTGLVENITAGAGGGFVSPGLSPGVFTAGSTLTWNADTTFAVELNGLASGTEYDRLDVGDFINLGGAKLAVSVGFTPPLGSVFTIVRNGGGNPVTGTFAGLPQGAILAVPGGFLFQINYQANGNDDITLTRVAGVAPVITNVNVAPGVGAETGLNVITVNASGTPGVTYQLETSLDLQTWTTATTQLANTGTGVLQYRFTQSPSIPKTFQRVRLP